MRNEPVWRRYARLLGANPRKDAEDELTFHYEMRVRDYRRRGLDETSARAAARARLGDVGAIEDVCAEQGEAYQRRNRRREWLGELRQDVKYGVRVLLRSPVFAAASVFTLALGIAATTSIFSVVHRVLLAPLPYANPGQLVNVWEHSPQGDDHNVVSPGNYVEWRRRARSFAVLGAQGGTFGMALTGAGEPQQVIVSSVTPSALRALNGAPLLGRTFGPEDEQGNGDVVVLSHAFWQQQLGADRNLAQRRLVLNQTSYTVVGVMRADFSWPDERVQVWLPLLDRELNPQERRSHNYSVIGRLATGVTLEQAQVEMDGIARALATEHPQHMSGWGVNVVGLQADLTAGVRPLLLVMLATVVVVLLIACGNLANLLLARAVAREGEFALRGALGAGRGRIVRQLLTESLVIGVSGGLLGVLFALLALRALLAAAPDNIPLLARTTISLNVLGFAGAVTLLSTLLFGLVPAVRIARSDLNSALRARGGSSVRHARLRGVLLVAEVTLTVVLLVGAGLLVRSFRQLQRSDLGYRTQDLVLMSIDLPAARYTGNAQQIDFGARLLDRLRSVPGVLSVAGTSRPPGSLSTTTFSFGIEGRQAVNPSGREDPEELRVITAEYFQTLGIPVRGRAFDRNDRDGAPPVIIINEALVRKHWPAENPIGKRIALRPGETPWLEIVGVAGNTRMASPDIDPVPALYVPHAQKSMRWLSWMDIAARVTPGLSSESLRPRFQAALAELDDQLPMQRFNTVEERYGANIAGRTFAMKLVLAFALVALLLSIVGLYGLMAYTVAQQRQEFGVRMALGARGSDIVRRVLSRSLGLALIGLLLGLAASLGATRLLGTLLYGVSPSDPITFGAIAALVLGTATLASWLPAQRAASSNPLGVLKGQ